MCWVANLKTAIFCIKSRKLKKYIYILYQNEAMKKDINQKETKKRNLQFEMKKKIEKNK